MILRLSKLLKLYSNLPCMQMSKNLPLGEPAVGLTPVRFSNRRQNSKRVSMNLLSMVGVTGLEPVTLRLSSACSNQLSYRPIVGESRDSIRGLNRSLNCPEMVEARGFEPLTSSLQSWRSTN